MTEVLYLIGICNAVSVKGYNDLSNILYENSITAQEDDLSNILYNLHFLFSVRPAYTIKLKNGIFSCMRNEDEERFLGECV